MTFFPPVPPNFQKRPGTCYSMCLFCFVFLIDGSDYNGNNEGESFDKDEDEEEDELAGRYIYSIEFY